MKKRLPFGRRFYLQILKSLAVKNWNQDFFKILFISGKSNIHSFYLYVLNILKRYMIFTKTASSPPQSASLGP